MKYFYRNVFYTLLNLLYFFVVEIIEENTKLRFNDVLFWYEKIRLLHQVVIKLCKLLHFVDFAAQFWILGTCVSTFFYF